MKNAIFFALGLLAGSLLGIFFSGTGNNNGSEFWGDQYAEILKRSGRGNNSGSKFYSDFYIREKFKGGHAG